MIKLFGKKGCPDCEWQKKAMRAVYSDSQWIFIDSEDNGEGTAEANRLDIKIFPAIVVENELGQAIMIKEGKIAPLDLKREMAYLAKKYV